jgi:hypothetical protein
VTSLAEALQCWADCQPGDIAFGVAVQPGGSLPMPLSLWSCCELLVCLCGDAWSGRWCQGSEVDEVDRGLGGVAGAGVVRVADLVVVVAGAFDLARVGPVTAGRVQPAGAGDLFDEDGQAGGLGVRGKNPGQR